MKKWFFFIVLIGLVAIGTYWVVTFEPLNVHLNDPAKPDSITTDIRAVQFDETGFAHHVFTSPKLSNYTQQQSTDVIRPFYIFHNPNEQPWHITADRGKLKNGVDGIDAIFLTGHVAIHQLPGINSRNIRLTTTRMTFYPKQSLAKTDQPVTIKQNGVIIHGVGLVANLKTGEMQLLSQTRGEYSPK